MSEKVKIFQFHSISGTISFRGVSLSRITSGALHLTEALFSPSSSRSLIRLEKLSGSVCTLNMLLLKLGGGGGPGMEESERKSCEKLKNILE